MSSKVISVLGAVAVGLALLAGATQGCGSSGSSSTNPAELCMRGCDKAASCVGEIPNCKASCTSMATGPNGQRCTNESAIVAKFNECLNVECSMLLGCLGAVPDCQGGTTGTAGTGATGTAGTTGSAGSGSTGAAGYTFDGSIPNFDASGLLGAGGSAGTTCGTACVKAEACCKALPGANPANCMFTAQCNAASNQAQVVQTCNGILQTATLLGASAPAACK